MFIISALMNQKQLLRFYNVKTEEKPDEHSSTCTIIYKEIGDWLHHYRDNLDNIFITAISRSQLIQISHPS
ncbi:hypothetical protein NC651_034574 [Populus alba x Populus x berolinensis]|nr:hypothetical protein NC651_034574 [Populus alba x Populus x berolinensis]